MSSKQAVRAARAAERRLLAVDPFGPRWPELWRRYAAAARRAALIELGAHYRRQRVRVTLFVVDEAEPFPPPEVEP